MKKLLSAFLATAMVATSFSLTAFAAPAEVSDPTQYETSDWTVFDHYGTQWAGTNDAQHPHQVADAYASSGTRVNGYFTDVIPEAQWTRCHDFDRHIMVKGNADSSSVLFAGYGSVPLTDFMVYNSTSTQKKVVNFDLDFARIDTHTLAGSFILVTPTSMLPTIL